MTCDRVINIRIESALMDRIREQAQADRISASAWIKQAIRRKLEAEE
jgi:predicted HicB family RNase H-like nuclease